MPGKSATFTGPGWYDEHLAPHIFAPFARELVARLPRDPGGGVLELACGTGVVTRPLRAHLAPAVELLATDLSPAMLAYAREHSPGAIEWREADAARLPFSDASFAAVVCGFGFMFPPDRAAAFAQARRVLVPGGLLAFSVWDRIEENPHARVADEMMETLLPDAGRLKFRLPYELSDTTLLASLLAQGRFADVRIETVRCPIAGADPRLFAAGQIRGTPRGALLAERGVDLDVAIARIAQALARAGGDPYAGHAQALLVQARAA